MTILVTGSGGRLGEALMRTLLKLGHLSVGVDIKASAFTHEVAAGMQVFAFQPHETDPKIPKNACVIKRLSESKPRLPRGAAEHGVAADGATARR